MNIINPDNDRKCKSEWRFLAAALYVKPRPWNSDSSHPSTLTAVWKFKSVSKVHVHYGPSLSLSLSLSLSISIAHDLLKIQTMQSLSQISESNLRFHEEISEINFIDANRSHQSREPSIPLRFPCKIQATTLAVDVHRRPKA